MPEPPQQIQPQQIQRRHDLDALRSAAMLLGIVLHAALSFTEGFWPVEDVSLKSFGEDQNPYILVVLAIHGFRMPLFFLLSGFFTTLLWQRRGLRALLSHRAKRIALPLGLGVITIVPLMNWLIDRALASRFGADYETTLSLASTEGLDSWLTSFHHLWFLWFLLWMVAGFALVALVIDRFANRSTRYQPAHGNQPTHASQAAHASQPTHANQPTRGAGATRVLLWLMPPTALLFALISKANRPPTWGPHTSAELIPDFWVLCYYGTFFAFGALLFSARTRKGGALRDSFGKSSWHWVGGVAVVLLLVGWSLTYETDGATWVLATIFETAHTWGMAYALIGLFTILFSVEQYWVRYMSDASYWLYLAHLPLIIFLQDLVAKWDVPALPKFLGICVVCVGSLMLVYRFGVRYTPVSWLLNGRRSKPHKALLGVLPDGHR